MRSLPREFIIGPELWRARTFFILALLFIGATCFIVAEILSNHGWHSPWSPGLFIVPGLAAVLTGACAIYAIESSIAEGRSRKMTWTMEGVTQMVIKSESVARQLETTESTRLHDLPKNRGRTESYPWTKLVLRATYSLRPRLASEVFVSLRRKGDNVRMPPLELYVLGTRLPTDEFVIWAERALQGGAWVELSDTDRKPPSLDKLQSTRVSVLRGNVIRVAERLEAQELWSLLDR